MVDPPSLLRSLTLRYLLALTLVGCLATAAFLFLHSVILGHENEAAVVNLSGRQRMLSQRIALAASQAVAASEAEQRQYWLGEMEAAAVMMERSHLALTVGDATLGIPADLARSIGSLYAAKPADVAGALRTFLADVHALANAPGRLDPPTYQRILVRSQDILAGLDDVVGHYQEAVEQRVRLLERLEIGVWAITLVVLILEALFIFRPMIQRVRASLSEEAGRRAAAEQQAMADQRRAEALVDTIADAVVTIDQDGLIRTFSPSAERMFGWSRADALGREVGDLMPDPYRQRHKAIIKAYLDGGRPKVIGVGIEVLGQRANGSTFPLELALGEWQSAGKRFFTAVMRDITQRKTLEESVRRAQKMEVVGQLSGGVAHDFNNLLGIISGNLELLEDRLKEDPKLLKRVAVAQHAAARGADLTRKLLSFTDSRTSQPQVVDLNQVILSSRDLLERLQTERIDVRLALANHLPPVRIDPGAFEDALLNMALNARDAMPDGGVLSVETRTLWPEETGGTASVMVCISDTGHGIAPADQHRIFEPFFTSKPPGKGTGLGLVSVDTFVKRSGGTIQVYSLPGQGTTFAITLPAGGATAPPGSDATDPPRGHETILVADDEDALRTLLCTQLDALGYRCLGARDAVEALAVLAANSDIALLVTDVIMPGAMDGIALAKQCRQRFPGLKILLSTGFAGRDGDDIRRLLPGTDIIIKPYRRTDLAIKVRALLDGDQADQKPEPSPIKWRGVD
jgi:PAS domain S-box-containing protein